MDLSKLRFLRRALAFLSFVIAVVAFVNFAFRDKPEAQFLTEIRGRFASAESRPSGDLIINLDDTEGTLYIKSSLAPYFDSSAFAGEIEEGNILYLGVEKKGIKEKRTHTGKVYTVRSGESEFLTLEPALEEYVKATNSARRGFIQFLILTMLLLIPEITRKRRLANPPQVDVPTRPIVL